MNAIIYPTDLTDSQWAYLQPLLPAPKPRGRKPADRRRVLNGILYLLRAGCAWRMRPRDFGPWKTVYHYFRLWSQTLDPGAHFRRVHETAPLGPSYEVKSKHADAWLYLALIGIPLRRVA